MPAYSGASVRPYSASPLLGCATRSVGASHERTVERCAPSRSTTASAQQLRSRLFPSMPSLKRFIPPATGGWGSLVGRFARPTSSGRSLRLWECGPDTCPTFLLLLQPRCGFCLLQTESWYLCWRPQRTWSGSILRRPLTCYRSGRPPRRPARSCYQKPPSSRRLHNRQ